MGSLALILTSLVKTGAIVSTSIPSRKAARGPYLLRPFLYPATTSPATRFGEAPMAMPTKVKIVDLIARDGLEGIKRLIPIDFRVDLINRLTDAGFPSIEVGEFVSPKVIPAMQFTDQVNHQINQKPGVEYSALV